MNDDSSPHNPHRDFFDDYFPSDEQPHITSHDQQLSQPQQSKLLHNDTLLNRPGGHYSSTNRADEEIALLQSLHSSTMGNYDLIQTPFGQRKVTYADFTASGRGLQFVEDYIQHEVIPLYGNTHTSSNTTGLQTTLFRHEARDIIRRACHASLTEDTVLFAGTGATGAVNMAIAILNLTSIVDYCKLQNLPLPVVIIGPYEHHSNILPWKETGAKIVIISERHMQPIQVEQNQLFTLSNQQSIDCIPFSQDICCNKNINTAINNNSNNNNNSNGENLTTSSHQSNLCTIDDSQQPFGCISQSHLKSVLSIITNQYHSPFIVTSFSAASNITGRLEDTATLTTISKSFGALVVFDFAGAASFKIDMNPLNLDHLKKDIVFFSPHKLLGGVGTPGVLIVKNYLLSRTFKPSLQPGGGTVFFVSLQDQVYLNNFHEREEGGTPDIIGSIRCGLIFKLKEQLGNQPAARINSITKTVLNIFTKHPFIQVVGHDIISNKLANNISHLNSTAYTGAISFLVYSTPITSQYTENSPQQQPQGQLLPPQFISSVLNDLFGIQSRHGCLCAGPYSHSLLGVDHHQSHQLLNELYQKHEDLRPGVTRVSFHYSMPLYVIEYIIKAILWVATHAVKLLPLYKSVQSSGEWKHHTRRTKEESRRWLNGINFSSTGIQFASKRLLLQHSTPFLVTETTTATTSTTSPPQFFQLNQSSQPTPAEDLNQLERLTLSQYLLSAHHLISDSYCTFKSAFPLNSNFPLFATQLSTMLQSDLLVHPNTAQSASMEFSFTWSDASLLHHLYTEADQQLSSLQQHHFTLPHPTFNSTLPLALHPKSDRVLLSLDKSTFPHSLGSGTHDTLFQFFSQSIQTTPKLHSLYPTSIPPHPQETQLWFPTPSEVLFVLQNNSSRSSLKSQNQIKITNHNVSPISTTMTTISPLSFYLLKQIVIQFGIQHPSQFLSPITPIHPGMQTSSTYNVQNHFSSLTNYLSSLCQQCTAQEPNSLPTFDISSTIDYLLPLTPTTIIKPKWFAANQNLQIDLSTLCINCWHRHHTPNLAQPRSSQECISCECVQFLPASNSQHSPSLGNPTSSILNNTSSQQLTTISSTTTPKATPLTTTTADPAAPMSKKQQKAMFRRVLGKTVSEAMIEFDMVRPGDRILVGVSGGKDSLSLIHALLEIQKVIPIPFEIAAATIDPMTADYDPSPLKEYFSSIGVTYFYQSFPIMAKAVELQEQSKHFSICAFCSRMRRGMLYSICRKQGYNVLALGQHLDDFAESFVMSAFHNSSLNTMKPHYINNEGDIRIIRPLCYTREARTREFAKLKSLPIISENCPACFEAPKERARVKLMLAAQEAIHSNLYNSICGALKPLMMMGLHSTPETKAAALVKYLSNDDQEDQSTSNNNTNNAKKNHHKQTKPSSTTTTNNTNNGTVSIPPNTIVPNSVIPTQMNDLDENTNALTDEQIVSIAVDDENNSGDEECAECVDFGSGLVCPVKKGIKRQRPNVIKKLNQNGDDNPSNNDIPQQEEQEQQQYKI